MEDILSLISQINDYPVLQFHAYPDVICFICAVFSADIVCDHWNKL